MDSKLSGVLDMLEEAAIQLSEASDELRHYHDRLDLDPNRLFELEQRISRQIALARKHQVMPEELPAVYQAMLEEQRLLDWQRRLAGIPQPAGGRTSSAGAGDRTPAACPAPGQRRRADPAYHRKYALTFDAARGLRD